MLRVDDLGNIYVVGRDNSISLFRITGQKFAFNEKSYGAVSNIDASNPLKVLVHYADANMLLILDNTLTEISRINLEQLGVFGLNVVIGTSKMGGFWLYNPISQNLDRYAYNGQKVNGTQLSSLFANIVPIHLFERDQKVYMSLDDGRLMVFDINGTYIYHLPAKLQINGAFQVEAGQIHFVRNDSLVTLNLESLEQKDLPLPTILKGKKKHNGVFVNNTGCYALLPHKILVYHIN